MSYSIVLVTVLLTWLMSHLFKCYAYYSCVLFVLFFILFAYLLYLQNCLFALHITNYGEIFAYLHVQF